MKHVDNLSTYVAVGEDYLAFHGRTFSLVDTPAGPALVIKDDDGIVWATFAPGMWQYAKIEINP